MNEEKEILNYEVNINFSMIPSDSYEDIINEIDMLASSMGLTVKIGLGEELNE